AGSAAQTGIRQLGRAEALRGEPGANMEQAGIGRRIHTVCGDIQLPDRNLFVDAGQLDLPEFAIRTAVLHACVAADPQAAACIGCECGDVFGNQTVPRVVAMVQVLEAVAVGAQAVQTAGTSLPLRLSACRESWRQCAKLSRCGRNKFRPLFSPPTQIRPCASISNAETSFAASDALSAGS